MTIGPDALGAEGSPVESSWDSTDCLLYALSVGAGMEDPAGSELEFTTENSDGIAQKALPTMCVVTGDGLAAPDGPLAALGRFKLARLLHGGQSIRLHKPLPVAATIRTVARVSELWDKGEHAVVKLTSIATDAGDGTPAYTNASTLVFRGEGGWGGERGPPAPASDRPDRAPDEVVSYTTRPNQALLYRLNGDRNPLHSDPAFAARTGFRRPVLHGMCTYGFTGRALLHAVCDGDPARFGGMDCRFSTPILPGDPIDVHIWVDGDRVWFRTLSGEKVVIDNGTMTLT